jgi:hypothetical protein
VQVHKPHYLNDEADVELVIKVREMQQLHLSLAVRIHNGECESFSLDEIWN